MMFHIGQQVVCLSAGPWGEPYGETLPAKGGVYTIREFYIRPPDGKLGLRLEEIINPVRDYGLGTNECSFLSVHFRPVKKTSIEIFEKLLAPAPRHLKRKARPAPVHVESQAR